VLIKEKLVIFLFIIDHNVYHVISLNLFSTFHRNNLMQFQESIKNSMSIETWIDKARYIWLLKITLQDYRSRCNWDGNKLIVLEIRYEYTITINWTNYTYIIWFNMQPQSFFFPNNILMCCTFSILLRLNKFWSCI